MSLVMLGWTSSPSDYGNCLHCRKRKTYGGHHAGTIFSVLFHKALMCNGL